jgi:glycosyltransferase involved in cell wall biosynthesis
MNVSVIMAVYNADINHLKEAVDSVLNQSYSDFEFIIVMDGDISHIGYLESIADVRVILLKNPKNMGLAHSLNRAIGISKGNYIFRMDADDISLKHRFESQLKILRKGHAVVSSGCFLINGNNEVVGRSKKFYFFHNFIRRLQLYILKLNPVVHPSIAARRDVYDKYKYDESFIYSQDFELWLRMKKDYKIYFDASILIKYRLNEKLEKEHHKDYFYRLAKSKK